MRTGERARVGGGLEVAPGLLRVADVDDERREAEERDQRERDDELDCPVFSLRRFIQLIIRLVGRSCKDEVGPGFAGNAVLAGGEGPPPS